MSIVMLSSTISDAARSVAIELCKKACLQAGQIVIVGCSTSEIAGNMIGTNSSPEIGLTVFSALYEVFSEHGVFLAAQCCEHLNRAVIINRDAVPRCEIVNVIPTFDAGGAFASAAYAGLDDSVVVEEIQADAGLDIGNTIIGMHLKKVAVPLRLDTNSIGNATVLAARTRPKFIGGQRAKYDEGIS